MNACGNCNYYAATFNYVTAYLHNISTKLIALRCPLEMTQYFRPPNLTMKSLTAWRRNLTHKTSWFSLFFPKKLFQTR